jgi:hypothetical protein
MKTQSNNRPGDAASNGDRPVRVADSRAAEIVKAAYLLGLTRR